MQDLLQSQGWARLSEILNLQIEGRVNHILASDEEEVKDFIELLRLKSERKAIKLCLALPQTIIDNIEADIKDARDDIEEQTAG